jgi:hypothetical protein
LDTGHQRYGTGVDSTAQKGTVDICSILDDVASLQKPDQLIFSSLMECLRMENRHPSIHHMGLAERIM